MSAQFFGEVGETYYGVTQNPDGTPNFSKAVVLIPDAKTAKEQQTRPRELPLPEGWTVLLHGADLSRPDWAGAKMDQLDADELVIQGQGIGGLSVISKRERDEEAQRIDRARQQGIEAVTPDTTRTYSQGSGKSLRIEVAFPDFNSRTTPLAEQQKLREKLRAAWTEAEVNQFFALCDLVYWKNIQLGRHPDLPRHLVLVKQQSFEEGTTRVVQYVPKVLLKMYETGIKT